MKAFGTKLTPLIDRIHDYNNPRKVAKMWLMPSSKNNNQNIILNILFYSGKPLFYLITFSITFLLILFGLFKKVIQLAKTKITKIFGQIRQSRITFPTIKLHQITTPARRTKVLLLLGLTLFYLTDSFLESLPSPEQLKTNNPSLTTKIYDRRGELLYKVYKDENRTLVQLQELPLHLIQATIAAEDKNYYNHPGISISGILRAAISNLTTGSLQGGSTITQQLVKNTLLTPEKTITRKVKEAVLALQIEKLYSKEEILEMYLNEVPYGGTAYGIEEASQQYFDKTATNLTLAEASLLAGLPAAPSTFSPLGNNPFLTKIRQNKVLETMVEIGYITKEEKEKALSANLTLNSKGIEIKAPHFVMYIRELLANNYENEQITKGGLEVTTTLDYKIQKLLQNLVTEEIERLAPLNVGNGAGMIVNPRTGDILAMVGSKDYFDFEQDGQVNVVLQPRQPGSAIKPITYALAFANGYTPATKISDTPVCYISEGQPNYCPKNYDGKFHGEITLRTALASSYNIPATKILNHLGVSSMVKLARQLGITTWGNLSRFGLALTLGGGEVTMYDLAQAYSVFANQGKKTDLNPIITINNSDGIKIPYTTEKVKDKYVISPLVAYQINDILSDPTARAPAFGYNSILNIPDHQVAVKTGTTNNLRDNWTIGYTQDLLVVIWVGNNDNTPMSHVASGITGASPIWSKTMKALLIGKGTQIFPLPDTLIASSICPETTTLYCNECPSPAKIEYFIPGSEPKYACSPDSFGTILDEAASTTTQ